MTRNLIKSLVVIEILIAAFQINVVNSDAKAKDRIHFTADGAAPWVGDYCVSKLKNDNRIVSTQFRSTDTEVATVKKINNRKVRINGVGCGWCDVIATVKVKTTKGIVIKKAKLEVTVYPADEY